MLLGENVMQGESRTAKSVKNILAGLTFRFVGTLFPFVIKTIVVWTLGTQYLGLNSLFSSILAVLSLSELGIGSALVYNMYKPIAEGNTDMICALLQTYKKFYRIIGMVILLLGLSLLPFLTFFIRGSYPQEINIYILYIICLCDTVLSYFLFAYKGALLEASQCNSVENVLHSITNIIMYGVQIIVLIWTKNYYLYMLIMPICTMILNVYRSKVVDKRFPQYHAHGTLSKAYVSEIFKKVRALIGHKVGTVVITSADNIVISTFLGLQMVAIYGNYHMIIQSLIGVITIFYTATMASIGNSLILDKKEKVYENFETLYFINGWIVGWCTICLCCLYQPFMKLWMGEDLMFPYHMVILFAIYFYCMLIRRIGLTYKDAAGKWQEDFWKPYIGALVNLFANIILINIIGIEGVIISTIIVMAGIYFPWETYVLGKYIFKRSMRTYVEKNVRNIFITIFAGAITYMVCALFHDGYSAFLLKVLACVVVPNLIFVIFCFNTIEFKITIKRIKRLMRL